MSDGSNSEDIVKRIQALGKTEPVESTDDPKAEQEETEAADTEEVEVEAEEVEAFEAGCAKGINFTFDDIIQYVTDFGNNMPDARPSMLLDHLDHRKSEIDAIHGMVPIVAREVGTDASYNEVISGIVRSRELAF